MMIDDRIEPTKHGYEEEAMESTRCTSHIMINTFVPCALHIHLSLSQSLTKQKVKNTHIFVLLGNQHCSSLSHCSLLIAFSMITN